MPRGSMLKYFEDLGGTEHGGALHWPGTPEGIPFRGRTAPDLKQEEFDAIQLALDYKAAKFDLWVAADMQRFQDVMDRIVNGWYMQHKRIDTPTDKGLSVWLEWVQIYGEVPNGKLPKVSKHEPSRQPDQPEPAAATVDRSQLLGWPG